MQKKKIAVIFGGSSTEYEVSLQSAFSVFENINKEKFDIVPIGITRNGDWYHYTGKKEKIANNTWFEDNENLYSVAVSQNRSVKGFIEFKEEKFYIIKVDLIFPVLHGKNGEDGTLQGLFELAGIPVVGCDTLSSALCMDKDRAHKLVSLAGVKVPKSVTFKRSEKNTALKKIETELSYPLFVKPVRAGSSFGITKVTKQQELENAIQLAFEHDAEVIVEEAIGGFEVGCAILGIDNLTVGRIDEIELSISSFAVATIDEGIRLRKYGISSEILILGYTAPSRAKELCKYELTQTLIDYRYSLLLNKQGYDINAHIKIDTGMHRLGFSTEDKDKILAAFSLKHIKVAGIFTHLCAADSLEENDVAFTNKQIGSFYKVLDWLKSSGLNIPKAHIQSSYGLLNYPELECDYIRVGVALYGVLSSTNDKAKLELDLRPVLSLKAKVVLIRKIKQGESVGYSRAFTATRDSLIAILPIGYADGFPRNLSCGNSYALIGGRQAPIVGKICMDQLAVDVTDIPNVKTGSIATLIGKDGKEEITAPMVAESAESITNELLSRMGHRLNIIRRA